MAVVYVSAVRSELVVASTCACSSRSSLLLEIDVGESLSPKGQTSPRVSWVNRSVRARDMDDRASGHSHARDSHGHAHARARDDEVEFGELHEHDGLKPHRHEILRGPGSFAKRRRASGRTKRAQTFTERAYTVGIGGPVGTGKTALTLALCRRLRDASRRRGGDESTSSRKRTVNF